MGVGQRVLGANSLVLELLGAQGGRVKVVAEVEEHTLALVEMVERGGLVVVAVGVVVHYPGAVLYLVQGEMVVKVLFAFIRGR